MATQEIRVPDIGDFENVEIIDVLVKNGDELNVEDPLITLETDKASMDVPSPVAGRVTDVRIANGDKVSEGDVIVVVDTVDDAAQDTSASAADGVTTESAPEAPQPRDVLVPDIGDFDNVDVIDVHVSVGDELAAEDPLITLETDKAAMDVPAPFAGKVTEVLVKAGDKVSEGDRIVVLLSAAAAAPATAASQSPDAGATAQATTAPQPAATLIPPPKAPAGRLPPINEAGFASAHASPAVRRFARELGVDLGRVHGTGAKNRVTRDDITAFVKAIMSGALPGPAAAALPEVPRVDFAKFGEIETKPLTRVQKISGPRLHASWINLPHVTQFDQADITDLEARRKALKTEAAKHDAKLTPLAFFVKACAVALQEFPVFNASLDASGENLVLKKYCHIGFAADTPNGLMVPVIRDADSKDLLEVAREVTTLAGQAREGKLSGEAMRGGSFTISSLGGIGGTAFTPIINAPEVAILGISRSAMTPVWSGTEFVPRLLVPLSLSYDHRVIDGAAAARFTVFLGEVLADPDALLPDSLK